MERTPLVVEKAVPIVVTPLTNKYPEVRFFSSGSTLLDLALGGGWAAGRVFNIVGDKSTGKSLLAIEGFANHAKLFSDGRLRYAEAEAAFDDNYAQTLGFPQHVERPEEMLNTVEDFHRDLKKFAEEKNTPSLYILDSLDALSDEAEIELFEKNAKAAEKGEDASASYGTGKAKKMSWMFRDVTRILKERSCSLGIISQIRDRIGVRFGETKMRTGGHALDFYSSQIIMLAEIGKLSKIVRGNDIVTGVTILAKVKKCKVGVPFKECEFDIIFDYGIDNHMSCLKWLKSQQEITKEEFEELKKKIAKAREAKDKKILDETELYLKETTITVWNDLYDSVKLGIRKYE